MNEVLTTFFPAATTGAAATVLPDLTLNATFGLAAIGTFGTSSEADCSDSLEANAMAQNNASRIRILKFIFHNNSLVDSGARLTDFRCGSIVL